MASTYTTNDRLTKQGSGENSGTWGTILNTVIDLVDDALDGYVSIDVSAGNITLTTNNGSADEARNRTVRLGGAPGAARSVTAPDVEKVYFIEFGVSNSQTITFKNTAGTGVALSSGYGNTVVICDGASTRDFFSNFTRNSRNLADLANAATARTNLGLTSAANATLGNGLEYNSTAIQVKASAASYLRVDTSSGLYVTSASTGGPGCIEVATTAEALTGTDTARAVTPAVLGGSGVILVSTVGYVKIPGGLIYQWGEASASTTTNIVTFPVAFSTSAYSFVATPRDAGTVLTAQVTSAGTATAGIQIRRTTDGAVIALAKYNWFAIGPA